MFVESGMTLSFWAWFDLEANHDYAYAEIATDGEHFSSIPGTITTADNPNGLNEGHGITGASNGWVEAEFPLEDFVGQFIQFRFRYCTDDNDNFLSGIYIDDIYPVVEYEDTGWADLDKQSLDPLEEKLVPRHISHPSEFPCRF